MDEAENGCCANQARPKARLSTANPTHACSNTPVSPDCEEKLDPNARLEKRPFRISNRCPQSKHLSPAALVLTEDNAVNLRQQ